MKNMMNLDDYTLDELEGLHEAIVKLFERDGFMYRLECDGDKHNIVYTSKPNAMLYVECSCGTVLAYWETIEDVFLWACEQVGVDPYDAVFVDNVTGEVLCFEDICLTADIEW